MRWCAVKKLLTHPSGCELWIWCGTFICSVHIAVTSVGRRRIQTRANTSLLHGRVRQRVQVVQSAPRRWRRCRWRRPVTCPRGLSVEASVRRTPGDMTRSFQPGCTPELCPCEVRLTDYQLRSGCPECSPSTSSTERATVTKQTA